MLKLREYPPRGFTLIELLVVVLIIGILAAIALPQYKMAVAKSKFSTLKGITKSLKESVDRYYLVHGTYPTQFSNLDIDLPVTNTYNATNSFYIMFPGVENCEVYYKVENNIYCKQYINSTLMMYGDPSYPETTRWCVAYSANQNDIPNKLCQDETGTIAEEAICGSSVCEYPYTK